MFARTVSMRLKANSAAEFAKRIEKDVLPLLRRQKGFRDEITCVNPEHNEAFAISFWDNKENAEVYGRELYGEVTKFLTGLIEGPAQVQSYEVANSTFHNIASTAATA